MSSNVAFVRFVRAIAAAAAMAAALVATAAPAIAQGPPPATITIVNNNQPGIGFNDPTPAAPVGGNTGTTLGEQRLIAFQYAASLWGRRISSPVPIRVRAQFVPLAPGVLGSAGPLSVWRDFQNAPRPGTWYHAALANALAGVDQDPTSDEINTNFSTLFPFYLGLDNKAPAGQFDLVAVLLHEFAHGLGFSQFSNLTTGALFAGFPDHYNSRLFDNAQQQYWPQMTNGQRAASATSFGRVILDAPTVTANIPQVLTLGSPGVQVQAPASIAGFYQFGTAAFGPAVGSPNVQGTVVAAVDAIEVGGASTDGCSPLSNAAAVAGNIALVERGLCGFAVKARNASEAGAIGVIIYNQASNVNAGPPGMAGDGINDAFVTAPTVSLRRVDGLAILGQIPAGVTAFLGADPTIRAGADALGRARVFAPFPVQGGSSISHYDSVASRNLLMEPAINRDLTQNLKAPFDLTSEFFYDSGWRFPDADSDGVVDDEDCNPTSDRRATIVLGTLNSGVPNALFANGCTMADLIATQKASSTTHGGYVSGVAGLTNGWVADGLITGAQKGAVQSSAARNK